MNDWQTVTLEDVTESINTGLDAIRRAPIVEHKTNLRCLRIQDISQNKPFDKWGYTEVKDSDFKKFQLVPNDIIMARTCSTGICYLVKKELPAVFNNGLWGSDNICIRKKKKFGGKNWLEPLFVGLWRF